MEAQEVEFEVAASPVEPRRADTTALAAPKQNSAPAALTDTAQVMSMIERLTLDTSIPIERAEQAFAFWQKVRADQAKREFIQAFSDCQGKMEPVAKDASNPQTRSKFASLAALDRAIRPIYTAHGFSVAFDADESPLPEHVRVLCILTHVGGHERIHHVDMPCDGKGAKGGDVMTKTHAMGSAFSYGKRYALGNAFNIATEGDDDGNAAGTKSAAPKFITAEQVAQLEALAKEVGADIPKFCEFGRVNSLAEIHASKFNDAVATLKAKAKAKAAVGAK